MNTSSIGTQRSQLGRIVLGILPGQGPAFGFSVHVLDSQRIRVVFDVPTDDSALRPSAYYLLPVSSAWSMATPAAASVEFFDIDQTSVAVTFAQPLTLAAVYSLQLQNIKSLDGSASSSISTYNFVATVPAPPRALGAYMSSLGCIDLVFDRPVRDTSSRSATAQITPVGSISPVSLVLQPPTDACPPNNVRFVVPSGIASGSAYLVNYQGVIDDSFNSGQGTASLDMRLQASPPYNYSSFTLPSMTAAYVDRISPSLGFSYIDVYFSSSMLESSILNTANWTITKNGVHASGTTPPFSVGNPVDDATLVSFCSAFKTSYNAHLTLPDIHLAPAAPPASISSTIRLINDLREKFNSHIVATPVHTVSDRTDLVNLASATTEARAIALVTSLKARFNAHLTGVSPSAVQYHFLNDLDDTIVTADPTTLQGAAALADEIRTKLLMHEHGSYHSYIDFLNAPTVDYCLATIVYPSIVTRHDAWAMLNEFQAKYESHVENTHIHVYADDTNVISSPVLVYDTLTTGIPTAIELKGLFNGHIPSDFPVTLVGVSIPAADPGAAPLLLDAFTYFAQLKVQSLSAVPSYSIQALLEATDDRDPLLSVVGKPLVAPPLVMSVVPRAQHLEIRTNRELTLPRTEDVRIVRHDGSFVNVTNVRLDTSLQALHNLLAETMDAFRIHLSESGEISIGTFGTVHVVTDSSDYITDDHFPTLSASSIIVAANYFKTSFNAHVNGSAYHVFTSASNAVSTPDATDLGSATDLIIALRNALLAHRANTTSHFAQGPRLQFARLNDTLDISYDGLLDGAKYTVSANLQYAIRDAIRGDSVSPFRLTAPFVGVADPPFVAAATPIDATGKGPVPDKLARDTLTIFFSKPMQQVPVTPDMLDFSGPSGLMVTDSFWKDSRALSTQIRGMQQSAQYGLDIDGLNDAFGNPIQSFAPPVPPPSVPYIPNSCVTQIQLNTDLPVPGTSIQQVINGDCYSVTFNDGRFAVYSQFQVLDRHLIIVEVYGASFGALTFDSVVNVLALDRSLVATKSGITGDSIEQIEVVLNPGYYYVEVTTQSIGVQGSVTVDVGTICHALTSPNSTYFGVLGVGCPSVTVPTSNAVFVRFPADAIHTTVTLSSAPSVTMVVHDGTDSGTVLGTGTTGVPIGFPTTIGNTYVLEVYTSDPGPVNFSLALVDA